MERLLLFIGIGLAAGGVAVTIFIHPTAGIWACFIGFPLLIACGCIMYLNRQQRGMLRVPASAVDLARAHGRVAVARIDAVRRTEDVLDEDRISDIELTVQPANRSAFRVLVREVLSHKGIERYAVGVRRIVALVSQDGPEAVILPDDPAGTEWESLPIPAAAEVGALQTTGTHTVRGDGSRRRIFFHRGSDGRPLRIVIYIAALIIPAGLTILFPLL